MPISCGAAASSSSICRRQIAFVCAAANPGPTMRPSAAACWRASGAWPTSSPSVTLPLDDRTIRPLHNLLLAPRWTHCRGQSQRRQSETASASNLQHVRTMEWNMPDPVSEREVDTANASYWLSRHRELEGDIRSVGNKGLDIATNEAASDRIRQLLRAFLPEVMRDRKCATVLDVGCGIGRFAPV